MIENGKCLQGHDECKKKTNWLVIGVVSSFIFGCILFNLNVHLHLRLPILSLAFVFFSLVLAPLLGIIACIISLKAKATSAIGYVSSILLIPVLSVLLLVAGRLFIIGLLPHIYTPPALTSKNLAVYNECIQFAKDNNNYKDIEMITRRWIRIDKVLYNVDYSLKGVFPEQEIPRIINLRRKLMHIKCEKFKRHNDVLIFYKAATSNLLAYPKDILWLFPANPGVVYSLNGDDPNEVDSWVLSEARPFIRITGNWYMSKYLMLTGPRSDLHASIPESLIDHSLRIDGVDPNELSKFN